MVFKPYIPFHAAINLCLRLTARFSDRLSFSHLSILRRKTCSRSFLQSMRKLPNSGFDFVKSGSILVLCTSTRKNIRRHAMKCIGRFSLLVYPENGFKYIGRYVPYTLFCTQFSGFFQQIIHTFFCCPRYAWK